VEAARKLPGSDRVAAVHNVAAAYASGSRISRSLSTRRRGSGRSEGRGSLQARKRSGRETSFCQTRCMHVGWHPPSSFLDLPSLRPSLDALPVASPCPGGPGCLVELCFGVNTCTVCTGPSRARGSTRYHLKGRLTFDSCWPFPSCRSVGMKGAKALVACLVLALLAGRASAKSCVIAKGTDSSCSFYSAALGMQLSLTQACVSVVALDSTNKYFPPAQPWYGKSKATRYNFIREVRKSCNFGLPNHLGVNTSPFACYQTGPSTTYDCKYYDCVGVTEFNNVKAKATCCGKKGCNALLSALN
jgi:hypothetical protein